MLIINADDFGRSAVETDVVLDCYKAGRLTSATAMVFMEDSVRAAEVAQGTGLDLGLHLNLRQPFTGQVGAGRLREYHDRIVGFLTSSKYSLCLYNPVLRQQFQYVYEAQIEEFQRLHGRHPSHIDGHHHLHLCTNMLVDRVIPAQQRVRRSFSFGPGEKNVLNRGYRRMVDWWLEGRYRLTDFFFSLQPCLQNNHLRWVLDLAQTAKVEVMTHPANSQEYSYLMSAECGTLLRGVEMSTYRSI